MKTKRSVEIEIETERLIIRHSTVSRRLLSCPFCNAEVEMIAAVQAALLSGRTLRWVINQIEISGLHFIEPANGLLYICLNSLLALLEHSQATGSSESTGETEAVLGERINLLKE